MKQCCKCNKEIITGFVICGDCVKKENQHFHNEEEIPVLHDLMTIWATPDFCKGCWEHIAREWSFCPQCGRSTTEKNMNLEGQNMKELITLKPCPFCGGKAELSHTPIEKTRSSQNGDLITQWEVICYECGTSKGKYATKYWFTNDETLQIKDSKFYDSRQKAIEEWNTRHDNLKTLEGVN